MISLLYLLLVTLETIKHQPIQLYWMDENASLAVTALTQHFTTSED